MEQKATAIQKAADLVSQYDHFLTAVKERASSFLGNAASVNRCIEEDFEALHMMLEQRKSVLLAEVQEEMAASRENDIFELEAKQRDMHSSLQQLQRLAMQGLVSEDNKCYQQLLAELNEAKLKLKEASDKFQIKFEGFLKPMASKIANYGQVVSGRGSKGNELKSVTPPSKCGIDFGRVFAVLSSQFEAQCQLQATRKEVKSFSENSTVPLSGWFEYSKKLQWRRTTTALSSEPAVPDFARIIKKMKDDFSKNLKASSTTNSVNVPDESYKKWLLPKRALSAGITSEWLSTSDTAANVVTRGFNSIAKSDTSSWLLHSSSHDVPAHHDFCNGDTSPWLLRSSFTTKEDELSMATVPLEQDHNEWLNPDKELEYQTWLSPGSYGRQQSKEAVSSWLHQDYSWTSTDHANLQWLLPRGGSVLSSGGNSIGDMHSDIFGSTQTLTSFGSSDFEVVDDTDL